MENKIMVMSIEYIYLHLQHMGTVSTNYKIEICQKLFFNYFIFFITKIYFKINLNKIFVGAE